MPLGPVAVRDCISKTSGRWGHDDQLRDRLDISSHLKTRINRGSCKPYQTDKIAAY